MARTNAVRGQVIFDSKKFPKLPAEERLAVTAHELAHIRCRHSLFAGLILVSGSALAVVIAWSGSLILPTLVWLAFYTLMVFYRRSSEYQADRIAASFVPPQSLISFLARSGSPGRLYMRIAVGLTHPRPEERVDRLKRRLSGPPAAGEASP